ncbi:hypothetical protein HGA34_03925 [Candidatus Falkowbacteria bacterium]|nr:hypothetical protein [Candidatus Falkowbacteria bacterium]
MSSNAKISIATILLITAFTGLISWISFNARLLDQIARANKQKNGQVDLVKLDVAYRQQVRTIVSRLAEIGDSAAEHQVLELRRELLDLFVPGKFKQLHVELVFALNQRLEFIQRGDQEKKVASDAAINKAKTEYSWLN